MVNQQPSLPALCSAVGLIEQPASASMGVTAAPRNSTLLRVLAAIPRWWFLGILCYAPWAYGSTRPWTINVLNLLLGCCLFFWLLDCIVARRWPRLPLVLIVVCGVLVTQLGWMTWNAGF